MMRSRLRSFNSFLKNNKKPLLGIAALTTMMGGVIAYKRITKKNENFTDAYEKFRDRIKSRTSHQSIESLFSENCKTRVFFPENSVNKKQQSIEKTTQLDATHFSSPWLTNEDHSKSELPALSHESWREFAEIASGEISITFGHRKAFSATNPIQFTHAVMHIVDAEGNHALYGYTSNKNNFIINDAINTTVSRQYTLYPDLTIKGNKQQMSELFKRIEHFSLQRYTAIGCNCYSPLISGLLEAGKMGFTVPHDFNDSLLIVIPGEQNYGMGITSNRYLKPLSESAVLHTQLLFKQIKDKASHKYDEVMDSLKKAKKETIEKMENFRKK